MVDSDGDGLGDGSEINNYGTQPGNNDTDGDGIEDGDEITTYFTNATNSDSDNDGLTDGNEIFNHNTNPNSNDTDSDGLLDKWELDGVFPDCTWINPTTEVVCDFNNCLLYTSPSPRD